MNKKCMGCGELLQNTNHNIDGYTSSLDNDICERCFRLKHYGEYKITKKNNQDYYRILNLINDEDLVVYVTSILNLNLDNINRFKKVLLVVTKKDIIPKSVKDNKIISYINEIYNDYIDIEVISSINNYNLDSLFSKIKKYATKRVYFVGNTNSGKSTLINKFISNYSSKDVYLTTSIYPSTTLDVLEINVDDLTFIDTPGIVNNGSIINYISLDMLKKITPKKEIKPRTYQIKGKGSLIIEDILRLDYETITSSMTIYIANPIKIIRVGVNNDKMKDSKVYSYNISNKDIVIEDLCFIKFTDNSIVNIYTSDGINIYERNNLI